VARFVSVAYLEGRLQVTLRRIRDEQGLQMRAWMDEKMKLHFVFYQQTLAAVADSGCLLHEALVPMWPVPPQEFRPRLPGPTLQENHPGLAQLSARSETHLGYLQRAVVLKAYQRDGVRWMLERETPTPFRLNSMNITGVQIGALGQGVVTNFVTGESTENREARDYRDFRGGLLGDDMGLGKTIQALAAIYLDQQGVAKLTFIVTRASLVKQWMEEARNKFQMPVGDWLGHVTRGLYVYVLSYDKLRIATDLPDSVDRLVLDEIDYARNHHSQAFDRLSKLKAGIRWGLT